MAHERQCWGRTGALYLRRCQRWGSWRIFCSDHAGQWLLVVLLLLALHGYFADYLTVSSNLRGPTVEELALQERVYTEISLAAHSWKIAYFTLYPDSFPRSGDGPKYSHVWERLREEPKPEYSPENWQHFRPLFVQVIDSVNQELQDILARDSDVLLPEIRKLVSDARLQLNTEKSAYLYIPKMDNKAVMFEGRFVGVIRMLEELDHEVQAIRDDIKAELPTT